MDLNDILVNLNNMATSGKYMTLLKTEIVKHSEQLEKVRAIPQRSWRGWGAGHCARAARERERERERERALGIGD